MHVINSVIVKLAKLTAATTVYRGISGFKLPPQFWKPNKDNVRGGIELGETFTCGALFMFL